MKSLKLILIYFLISFVNIAFLMADYLPAQPGDPGIQGGMSVPIDGGILMGILAATSLASMFFKKKKKDV